ncbi:MAG: sugar phosphate nucleotidyltransferase [Leptospirales bacterium]|nr:sugar phosphate nucleotidyltransferase [Leptospirales bacterium]
MKAFLLAAGYGSRLAGISSEQPKPLVKAAGIPLICYSLAMLRAAGVDEIVCNLHYLSSRIVSFFEENNNFGFRISFSFENEILGTGGGLKRCRESFGDEGFFLINSDIITDLDLNSLKGASRVALYRSETPTVSVKNGMAVDFKNALESGIPSSFDYMGAAFLLPEIFDFLEDGFSSIVYTGYTSLASRERLGFYEHNGFWIDAGTLSSLDEAERILNGEAAFIVRRTKEILGL